MKILIIGKTGSGKSTFAKRLQNNQDFIKGASVHEMSEYFKTVCKEQFYSSFGNKIEEFILKESFAAHLDSYIFQNIQEVSLNELNKNVNCNIDYIEKKFNKKLYEIDDIFVGFRNPNELIQFLNSDKNIKVFYLNKTDLKYKDKFEKTGLKAILKIIKFYELTYNKNILVEHTFETFEEFNKETRMI